MREHGHGLAAAEKLLAGAGDAVVLDIANSLEKSSPGIVEAIERKVVNVKGETLTDFDVETKDLVIEVTKGGATGKTAQVLERLIPNTQKEVVVFIKGKGGGAVEKALKKAGVRVFRDKNELIDYTKFVQQNPLQH